MARYRFWLRVIEGYTGGRYQETRLDDERWCGSVQSFETGRPAA